MNTLACDALVLGANGYIGSNLCYWLLQQGCTVTGVGRATAFKGQVPASGGVFTYLTADLSQPEAYHTLPLHAPLIYMMAGATGTAAGFTQYQPMLLSNELALLHLLHALQNGGYQSKVIFPSTRLVYKGQPNLLLPEDAPKETKTVYAVNKLACEGYLQAWHNAFTIPFTIFRICVLYGHLLPGQYAYGPMAFMQQQARQNGAITLYGQGQMRRTFTHVQDICQIMHKASQLPQTNGLTLNIGSNDHWSLQQVTSEICLRTGASLQYAPWPTLDEKLESGDTMFADEALQNIMPYTYQYQLIDYLQQI